MSELELTPNLKQPKDEFHEKFINTYSGQAHLAGTGPKRRTCRECQNWSNNGDWYAQGGKHGGKLKPAHCTKYTSLMAGERGDKVPHHASACRFFDLSDMPLQIISK